MSDVTNTNADATGRRELLRHALATLAYRGGKAVRGAPDAFGGFHLAATSRTPVQILAHIGDLLDWGLSLTRGEEAWHNSPPLAWPDEVSRFYEALERLDARLAAQDPKGASIEQLHTEVLGGADGGGQRFKVNAHLLVPQAIGNDSGQQ